MKLKTFEVTATMDVGYVATVKAKSEDEAWEIAREQDLDWKQSDEGHDWTLECVYEKEKVNE
tara:strand:+ start:285 stop:470 length:186 start_codon:yes stop_codon:yes gene_type:complete